MVQETTIDPGNGTDLSQAAGLESQNAGEPGGDKSGADNQVTEPTTDPNATGQAGAKTSYTPEEVAKIQSTLDMRASNAETAAADAVRRVGELESQAGTNQIADAKARVQGAVPQLVASLVAGGMTQEAAQREADGQARVLYGQIDLQGERIKFDADKATQLSEGNELARHRIASEHGVDPEKLKGFQTVEQMTSVAGMLKDSGQTVKPGAAKVNTAAGDAQPDALPSNDEQLLQDYADGVLLTPAQNTRAEALISARGFEP